MSIQSPSRQHATPPECVSNPPLSPPPGDEKTTSTVLHIIAQMRNRYNGRNIIDIPWARYTLDRRGYEDLWQQLKKDECLWGFVGDKVRLDYFPSVSRLVLRMPSTLHAIFIHKVMGEIEFQLRSLTGASAEFAKEIYCGGAATIVFAEEEYGRHDPDTQFRSWNVLYPGVVIEVSYPQKRKDLRRLAEDYILGSNGDIQVVVALDIEYQANKRATFSLWRPNIITNAAGEVELHAQKTITDQVFRDSNGITSRTGDLQLYLQDFTTKAMAEPEGRLQIAISANTLCAFLGTAEAMASPRSSLDQ